MSVPLGKSEFWVKTMIYSAKDTVYRGKKRGSRWHKKQWEHLRICTGKESIIMLTVVITGLPHVEHTWWVSSSDHGR